MRAMAAILDFDRGRVGGLGVAGFGAVVVGLGCVEDMGLAVV